MKLQLYINQTNMSRKKDLNCAIYRYLGMSLYLIDEEEEDTFHLPDFVD
jgi:hypothetical protein